MNILYVASAKPPKARLALDALRARFPEATVAIATCPDFDQILDSEDRQRVIFRAGTGEARLRFIRNTRSKRYEWVAVVWGGDRGYLTMKLAAFLLRPRRALLCFNENGDAFEWRWRNRRTVLRHIRWRLQSPNTATGWPNVAYYFTLRALQLCIGEPLGILLLLVRTVVLLFVCVASNLLRTLRPEEHM